MGLGVRVRVRVRGRGRGRGRGRVRGRGRGWVRVRARVKVRVRFRARVRVRVGVVPAGAEDGYVDAHALEVGGEVRVGHADGAAEAAELRPQPTHAWCVEAVEHAAHLVRVRARVRVRVRARVGVGVGVRVGVGARVGVRVRSSTLRTAWVSHQNAASSASSLPSPREVQAAEEGSSAATAIASIPCT